MTADSDTSAFFEKHSIIEIEQLLAKTRNDIEKKKEELRVMVGERYRDLIEAADTISDMQNSAESICKNIHTMQGLCESLQQRGLIGFKTRLTPGEADTGRFVGNEQLYSFATQIKLLVDVPEILWSLTEKGNLLNATQLLLLAQHTHTAIQLSPHSSELLPQFPVVSYQWSTIMQFKSTIIKGCRAKVKNEIDDHEPVLDALVSMMLIDGIGIEDMLDKALTLRESTLEKVLLPKPSSLAKDQLMEFVMLFMSFFDMIKKIFIAFEGGGTCLLEKKIKSITKADPSGTSSSLPIHLLQESPLALDLLPKSIMEFRPKLHCNLQTLERVSVKRKLSTWLDSLVNKSKSALEELFNCTTNIKALSLIRNSILETQSKYEVQNIQKISTTLQEDNIDPWNSMIRPKVLERAKHLVKKELEDIRLDVIRMVKELANEIVKSPKVCAEEGDITSFVWGESASDLPEKFSWASASLRQSVSSSDISSGGKGLFYKTRGYTKRIQSISRHLNGRLELLLNDMMQYSIEFSPLESSPGDQIGLVDRHKLVAEDFGSLLKCMEEETVRCFKSCATELSEVAMGFSELNGNTSTVNLWEENKASKPSPGATILIVVSRLCNAFCLVCNHLRISSMATFLVHSDSARRLNLGVQMDSQSWSEVRTSMLDSSNRLMVRFLSHLCKRLEVNLSHDLRPILQSSTAVETFVFFPSWENIDIEEEDESGNKVKSTICIPSHPSPILSQALMKLCSSINYVSVHTVTRSSLSELNRNLCLCLVSVYESLNDHYNSLNQTTALQLLFDIKLIQTTFLPRDLKEVNLKFSEIIQKLESKVDPFDLDVFLPHINSRVKTSMQRLQVLLGILIPKERQLLSKSSSSISGGNSILQVVPSVEIPRFSNVPLPVTSLQSPFSLHSKLSLDDQSLLPSSSSKNERESGSSSGLSSASLSLTASRSAASLLSAMSSSWFGGGNSS